MKSRDQEAKNGKASNSSKKVYTLSQKYLLFAKKQVLSHIFYVFESAAMR